MHESSVMWLRISVVLYGVGLLHAILMALRVRLQVFRVALATFCVGAVLHMVAIVEEIVSTGQFPLHSFHQTVSFCGFLIALSFLLIYWRYGFESLSVFLFPLVFLMALLGSLVGPVARWNNTTLRDVWLLLHVLLVLLGYAALFLMAASAVAYLIRERELKSKKHSRFADRLPPLSTLDELISRSMAIGFVLITLGVIVGSTWAFVESGTGWIGEPKIVISVITWGFYLVMVFLRASAGWRGRKAAFMSIVAVGFSALTWVAHIGLRTYFTQP